MPGARDPNKPMTEDDNHGEKMSDYGFEECKDEPPTTKAADIIDSDDNMSGNGGAAVKDQANLPTIDQLLEQHSFGAKFGDQNVALIDMEEEVVEPNMEFVRQFDKFGKFHKAAGFIEDWIRTKKHNATDFTNDFPAVLDRGKKLRKVLIKLRGGDFNCEMNQHGAPVAPEIRNVHQLILTKQLYATEAEYIFYFTLQLIEACCIKQEVPQLVIRIMINTMGNMVNEGSLVLSKEMVAFAKNKLGSLRAEVVFDFVKAMHMNDTVDDNYFFKLAQDNITNGKFAEAAIIITKFRFFDKFDIL